MKAFFKKLKKKPNEEKVEQNEELKSVCTDYNHLKNRIACKYEGCENWICLACCTNKVQMCKLCTITAINMATLVNNDNELEEEKEETKDFSGTGIAMVNRVSISATG